MGWNDSEFRVVFGGTTLDYDEDKEQTNREDHEYSLASAVHFLECYVTPFIEHPPFITRDALSDHGEVRHEHMTVGDEGEVVFFVTTMRADETVRVISLRRASRQERAVFKEYTGYTED